MSNFARAVETAARRKTLHRRADSLLLALCNAETADTAPPVAADAVSKAAAVALDRADALAVETADTLANLRRAL